MAVKGYLTRVHALRRTIGTGGVRLKKLPLDLWLDDERKKAMGHRLTLEIKRAKTTKARLAAEIGCTRATLTYACQKGSISLELLAEVVRRINSSMDYVIFGRHPTADPEFQELLDKLKSKAAHLAVNGPKH